LTGIFISSLTAKKTEARSLEITVEERVALLNGSIERALQGAVQSALIGESLR
jgi:hypothetical protein